MKFKLLMPLLLILVIKASYSQIGNSNLDLKLDLGYSYQFLDYIGGPNIGLVLENEKNHFGLKFRTDYLIKMEREMSDNPLTPNIEYGNKFVIRDYYNLSHLYAFWGLDKIINQPLNVGLGISWIGTNETYNAKLNSESGYYALSISTEYKVSWIRFELRGNIPLQKVDYNSNNSTLRLFPLEISTFYRWKPREKNK